MGKRADAEALVARHGSVAAAARESGIPRTTLRNHLTSDPAIEAAMGAVGTGMTPRLVWAKTKNDDGTSYSVLMRPDEAEFPCFLDHIRETIADVSRPKNLPPRFEQREGNMLVLDPADVHIGKLSVKTETGYAYDSAVAEHRLVEGCRALVETGSLNGCTRVLLVIGNDIAHIDNPRRQTTSGTPQDTDGSIFTIHRAAQNAYIRVIEDCLAAGMGVTIIFNPSNHDWVLGFTIAQFVRAWFKDHPNVDVSDYAVSEQQRKYVRFGRNLIGFTHGGDAKQGDLPALMMVEARTHISEAHLNYWYVHHWHHKVRRAAGVRPMDREKDHISMTVLNSGVGAMEGDNAHIEIVRSPSAPDGWHTRNGYLNRQAVEAFVHHPEDGQIMRFTEWF